MDRTFVLKRLAFVQEHVAGGEERIARQRRIIIELRNDGHATDSALQLLEILEAVQDDVLVERNRLLSRLQEIP